MAAVSSVRFRDLTEPRPELPPLDRHADRTFKASLGVATVGTPQIRNRVGRGPFQGCVFVAEVCAVVFEDRRAGQFLPTEWARVCWYAGTRENATHFLDPGLATGPQSSHVALDTRHRTGFQSWQVQSQDLTHSARVDAGDGDEVEARRSSDCPLFTSTCEVPLGSMKGIGDVVPRRKGAELVDSEWASCGNRNATRKRSERGVVDLDRRNKRLQLPIEDNRSRTKDQLMQVLAVMGIDGET